jgi:MFS family permease
MSTQSNKGAGWAPPSVTNRQVKYATIIAFSAWAFAVFDFVLFGNLLPQMGADLGWDAARQANINGWVSIGVIFVALSVGPIVDRFGRRAGVMTTVGGAAIFSALTALAGSIALLPLILIRAFAGLGYAEQGVNGAYLSELYSKAEDRRVRERAGSIYGIVQGGWPIGALMAAGFSALLIDDWGWQGVFIFAGVASGIIGFLAMFLRESPHFQVLKRIRDLRAVGDHATASIIARENNIASDHSGKSGFLDAFRGAALRPTLVLTLTHVLGWMPVLMFGILGTSVITSVHGVSFENSLLILVGSNLVGFIGYLCHGVLGDRIGRRNTIALGWTAATVAFIGMLFGPSSEGAVIALYAVGMFFLIGPYACVLFFVGESFPTAVRGTGASIVVGVGPVGATIASFGIGMVLAGGGTFQTAALLFGAVPCLLSAIVVMFARDIRSAEEADLVEAQMTGHQPAAPMSDLMDTPAE